MQPIVSVQGLSKAYRSYSKPAHRLLERLTFNKIRRHMLKYALQDVSFDLMPGDRLGIMGENGSGKSTLLKILSGVLTPTSGEVAVNGKIAALLELGTGFHHDMTGRENVFQNGYIMGYSEEEMQERYPRILEFSEIGEAVDYPVKGYSSGMLMRLAFACSVFVEPDILIVDEALSVGDAYFQTKCFYKIKSLIENGTTFLYVSHGQDSVRTLCNKAIVLESGRIIQTGEAAAVADFYSSYMYARQAQIDRAALNVSQRPLDAQIPASSNCEASGRDTTGSLEFSINPAFDARVSALRQGNGAARIRDVKVQNSSGRDCSSFVLHEIIVLQVYFETYVPTTPFFSLGVGIMDSSGLNILQCTLIDKGISLSSDNCFTQNIVTLEFDNILCGGDYHVVAGLAECISGSAFVPHEVYDQCYGCAHFSVSQNPGAYVWGKVDIPFTIKTSRLAHKEGRQV